MSLPEAESKPVEPLFSESERLTIVRNFIEAYLANEVTITWPTAETYKRMREGTGSSGSESPEQAAISAKRGFLQAVNIVTQNRLATADEMESAISLIFTSIVAFRIGDRISGSFLKGPRLEQRLKDLEDKAIRHDELLKELRVLFGNIRGPSEP